MKLRKNGRIQLPTKCGVDNHTAGTNAKGKLSQTGYHCSQKTDGWFITDAFYHNCITLCDNKVVECQELI